MPEDDDSPTLGMDRPRWADFNLSHREAWAILANTPGAIVEDESLCAYKWDLMNIPERTRGEGGLWEPGTLPFKPPQKFRLRPPSKWGTPILALHALDDRSIIRLEIRWPDWVGTGGVTAFSRANGSIGWRTPTLDMVLTGLMAGAKVTGYQTDDR